MSVFSKNDMPVIAIDGPAGSGKSTIAKLLAKEYKLYQIDSGALYRAYTYATLCFAKENNFTLTDSGILENDSLIKHLKQINIEIEFTENMQITKINGLDAEPFIRTPEISENIKSVADSRFIRDMVNEVLKKAEGRYPIVADGRDMGTVVYPDADLKFFITASLKERAKRRLKEFAEKYPDITLEEVEKQIEKRDKDDENRPFGALKRAPDAIFIDTTCKDLNQVFIEVKKNFRESSSKRIRKFIESLNKS